MFYIPPKNVFILLSLRWLHTGAYRERHARIDSRLSHPVLRHHYTDETCSSVVAGSRKREGWGQSGCKCPRGSLILGPTPDCQQVRGTRYFGLDQLKPGKCRCEQDVSQSCLKTIPNVGCRFKRCDSSRNASCEDGKCTCKPGFCAVSGVCVRHAASFVQPVLGPLPFTLKINRAQLNRSTTFILPMEPFVKSRLGTKRFKTTISEGGGQEPVWRYEYLYLWEGEQFLHLKVMERSYIQEEIVGAGVLDMAKAYEARAEAVVHSVNLRYKNTPVGQLSISVHWEMYLLVIAQRHCQAKNQSMRVAHSVRDCAETVRQSGGKFFATAKQSDTKTAQYPCYNIQTTSFDCGGNWAPGDLDFYTLDVENPRTYDSTCKRDTLSPCKWVWKFAHCRKFGPAVCTDGKCMCKQGFCFRDGRCRAECEAVSSENTSETTNALIDLNLKTLERGNFAERAHALKQLGQLGKMAASHADMVAQYVDYGFSVRLGAESTRWLGSRPSEQLYWASEYSASGYIGGAANLLTRFTGSSIFPGFSAKHAITAGALGVITYSPVTYETLLAAAVGAAANQLSLLILPAKLSQRGIAHAAIRANATEALSHMGKCGERYGGLISLRLGDSFPNVRMEALDALQRMPQVGAKYVGEIAFLLNDPEYSIRNKARSVITVLGEDAGAHAADDVASMLISDKPLVQILAIQSLGMLGAAAGKHVVEVAAFLNSTELNLKQAAAETLSMIGPAVAAVKDSLIQALRNEQEDELVRGFVAATLFANDLYLSEVERFFPEGGGLPPVVSHNTAAVALKRYLQESRARVLAEQKQHQAELALTEAKRSNLQLLTRVEHEQKDAHFHQEMPSTAFMAAAIMSYILVFPAVAISCF